MALLLWHSDSHLSFKRIIAGFPAKHTEPPGTTSGGFFLAARGHLRLETSEAATDQLRG